MHKDEAVEDEANTLGHEKVGAKLLLLTYPVILSAQTVKRIRFRVVIHIAIRARDLENNAGQEKSVIKLVIRTIRQYGSFF